MSNMFETVIGKIFSGTNFTKMMVVLAIEGVAFLLTKQWTGWTVLNAVIYFVVGYCLLLFIVWLYKKLKPSEFRSIQKEQDKEWKNNVLSFFYSLPQNYRDALLLAYTSMDKDKVYNNKRNSSSQEHIALCKKLQDVDFKIPRNGYWGPYLEKCVIIEEKNGVATIVFDPVVCKELDKTLSLKRKRQRDKKN